MKNRLFFFTTALFLLSFISSQAQTSLAEITGEENSLFNALAIYNNVEPEEFTVTEFREAAEAYGESIGMDYVCHPKNGWNNVEMLWHRLPSPELRRTPRVTMKEPTIGVFTTKMDVETQLVIQCIIKSYRQGDSGILFTDNPLDTDTLKTTEMQGKVNTWNLVHYHIKQISYTATIDHSLYDMKAAKSHSIVLQKLHNRTTNMELVFKKSWVKKYVNLCKALKVTSFFT